MNLKSKKLLKIFQATKNQLPPTLPQLIIQKKRVFSPNHNKENMPPNKSLGAKIKAGVSKLKEPTRPMEQKRKISQSSAYDTPAKMKNLKQRTLMNSSIWNSVP